MVLQTNGLTKTYRRRNVVNNVDMKIEKGDIYGFIGKNGAGKTTLMKMICGLARPSAGNFTLFDSDNIQEGRKKIGCVIEQPALFPGMTARENLIYYSKMQGCDKSTDCDRILSVVGLPDTGKLKTKGFSLGMKQRLSIAIALLGNPEFLVLDEPINGLDPAGILEVRQLLLRMQRDEGMTVLISSHILGELGKMATRYGIINAGNLVEEFTAEELHQKAVHYVRISTDDQEGACQILREQFGVEKIKILPDSSVCVYERTEEIGAMNRALVSRDITVSHLAVEGQDMEKYFVERMGGM